MIFIELCDQCVSRKVFPKEVCGKPIISLGFMTKIQMDLIDMRSAKYNGFKWIFHAKDHFSKYSWLHPSNDGNQVDEHDFVIDEEDLPDGIFEIIKSTAEFEEPPVGGKTNDGTGESVVSNIPFENDKIADQPQNIQEITSDYNIDHEELVDVASMASNIVEPQGDSTDTNRHKRIREEAEESYLHNAHAQFTRYMNRSCKRQRNYSVGDIVGLKVSDVDRTNTSSTILPCKIIGFKDEGAEKFYNVTTMNSIIQESFVSTSFLDLTASNFSTLRELNIDSLSTITFIQACQLYTNFKSGDTCKCNGSCTTNRCQCKKNGRKCCTKCHGGNSLKCSNC